MLLNLFKSFLTPSTSILIVIVIGLSGVVYMYKTSYEKTLVENAEVVIARDLAVNQLNTLAEEYANQTKKVNEYQERIRLIGIQNAKFQKELETYKKRITSLPKVTAEEEANQRTKMLLEGMRK
jgi:hypothetical protein